MSNSKMAQHSAIHTMAGQWKVVGDRIVPCSMTLNDPTPGYKVMPFFDAEYFRNSRRCIHSFNGILIGIYTRPTQGCHFE